MIPVEESGSEGVTRSDGIADLDRMASKSLSLSFEKDAATVGTEGHADDLDSEALRPGRAERLQYKLLRGDAAESSEGFGLNLVEFQY